MTKRAYTLINDLPCSKLLFGLMLWAELLVLDFGVRAALIRTSRVSINHVARVHWLSTCSTIECRAPALYAAAELSELVETVVFVGFGVVSHLPYSHPA